MIVEGRINDTTESLYEICDRKVWQKIKEMGENEVSGLLDSIAKRFLSLHKFELLIVRKGWLKGLIFWQGKKYALLQNTTYLDYQ